MNMCIAYPSLSFWKINNIYRVGSLASIIYSGRKPRICSLVCEQLCAATCRPARRPACASPWFFVQEDRLSGVRSKEHFPGVRTCTMVFPHNIFKNRFKYVYKYVLYILYFYLYLYIFVYIYIYYAYCPVNIFKAFESTSLSRSTSMSFEHDHVCKRHWRMW